MRSDSSPRAVSITIGTCERERSSRRDLVAGAVGEHQVEEHEVGLDLAGLLDRLGDGAGLLGVEALALERRGERLDDRALVLDEQDGAACAQSWGSRVGGGGQVGRDRDWSGPAPCRQAEPWLRSVVVAAAGAAAP